MDSCVRILIWCFLADALKLVTYDISMWLIVESDWLKWRRNYFPVYIKDLLFCLVQLFICTRMMGITISFYESTMSQWLLLSWMIDDEKQIYHDLHHHVRTHFHISFFVQSLVYFSQECIMMILSSNILVTFFSVLGTSL